MHFASTSVALCEIKCTTILPSVAATVVIALTLTLGMLARMFFFFRLCSQRMYDLFEYVMFHVHATMLLCMQRNRDMSIVCNMPVGRDKMARTFITINLFFYLLVASVCLCVTGLIVCFIRLIHFVRSCILELRDQGSDADVNMLPA